jgi:hypothetical protein
MNNNLIQILKTSVEQQAKFNNLNVTIKFNSKEYKVKKAYKTSGFGDASLLSDCPFYKDHSFCKDVFVNKRNFDEFMEIALNCNFKNIYYLPPEREQEATRE